MGAAEPVVYPVEGLGAPVEILVDRWGVPHIYASTKYDAFFAQGFNAARDRLWQMDLWRRRGLGRLAEVLGPSYVEQDRAARLFLYRGDMFREWLAYGSDTKRVVTAFAEGINRYVELARHRRQLMPLEFETLGYEPDLWAPEDVVRIRSHSLAHNLGSEVKRALVLRDFGPDAERLRVRLEPPWTVSVPEGLDLDRIPDDVLRNYELAVSGVEFSGGASGYGTSGEVSDAGSNNWAVSGRRTSTGRPILANDPHRDQSVPSLRYIAHLSAPGLDVIGAGEPVAPGISQGHNGKIGFTMTFFRIDQQDLYVYETNPDDPSEYRYRDRWEPMEVVREQMVVSGGERVFAELKFTRHGPVIYEDPDKHTAFAVRAAWLEPGMSPYLASLDYMQAQSWDDFQAALNRWGTPGGNHVYADVDGNIGWKAAGLSPKRPNWDGLLPVPGDGRYEWDGYRHMDELPAEYNPPRGWIATGNEMNLPHDYPYAENKLGFEWATTFRYERMREVLEGNPGFSLRDSSALQADYLSVPARRIVGHLGPLHSEAPEIEEALTLLGEWDCVLSEDSPAAALFEVWYRLHLRAALVEGCYSSAAGSAILENNRFESDHEMGDARELLALIENPDERLGSDPPGRRNAILLSSLREAISDLKRRLGRDMSVWKWGDLHRAQFVHPLSSMVEGHVRGRLRAGDSVPRGGSGDTVGQTGYRTGDFRQIKGGTWRVTLDIGDWDASLAMNAPGQSGDPEDPHYADLASAWAKNSAFPLLYSREKVEAATERRILLEPEGKP